MDTRYAHTDAITPELPADVAAAPGDYLIFNAPRPLTGDHHWQGGFRAGVFYAAVEVASPNAQLFVDANERDAAVLVELVDNDRARELIDAALAAGGYSIADYREAGMDYPDVAAERGIPWVE